MPIQAIHNLHVLRSTLTSTLTGWRGTNVVHVATQPPKLLQLYYMEGSPYCRNVREALTAMGLDAEIFPCPQGGKRFRPEAERLGGKRQFPLLVDPNTSIVLYESADIIDYLFKTYAGRLAPWAYRPGKLRPLAGGLGSVVSG